MFRRRPTVGAVDHAAVLQGMLGSRVRPATVRQKVWETLEYPLSSKLAMIVNGLVLICIIASSVTFVLESTPFFTGYPFSLWLYYLEVFFVTIFTVEYALRLWSTPDTTWRFATKPLNLIDLISVLPFYLDLAVAYFGWQIDMRVVRVVRLARLFRLAKIGKYSPEIQVLVKALARSGEAVVLLMILLGCATMFFSALMVAIERGHWNKEMGCYVRHGEDKCSPFQSMPEAFYWAVATFTTVGYGDATPITPIGKVVTGIAMLCGILIIAVPVGMLGEHFTKAYEDIHDELGTQDQLMKHMTKNGLAREIEACLSQYDVLCARHREKLPQIHKLTVACMASKGTLRSQREAEKHVDPMVKKLVDAFEKTSADMKRFVSRQAVTVLANARLPSSSITSRTGTAQTTEREP